MATVCACEDSYHRQVQGAGGRGDNVNNMHLRVPLPLPLALSMFLFEFLSRERAISLLHPLLFFPSIHHSPCVRASLSLANIPVRVAHALRRLMEDRGPPLPEPDSLLKFEKFTAS